LADPKRSSSSPPPQETRLDGAVHRIRHGAAVPYENAGAPVRRTTSDPT
jgi:hypothetical protein